MVRRSIPFPSSLCDLVGVFGEPPLLRDGRLARLGVLAAGGVRQVNILPFLFVVTSGPLDSLDVDVSLEIQFFPPSSGLLADQQRHMKVGRDCRIRCAISRGVGDSDYSTVPSSS